MPLHFEPWGDGICVVFRKPTRETSRTMPKVVERELATIKGPWKVAFEPVAARRRRSRWRA